MARLSACSLVCDLASCLPASAADLLVTGYGKGPDTAEGLAACTRELWRAIGWLAGACGWPDGRIWSDANQSERIGRCGETGTGPMQRPFTVCLQLLR